MKPVFCGNFEYDAREGDLERLFRKYGRVERVDMKAGKPFFFLSFFLSTFCVSLSLWSTSTNKQYLKPPLSAMCVKAKLQILVVKSTSMLKALEDSISVISQSNRDHNDMVM